MDYNNSSTIDRYLNNHQDRKRAQNEEKVYESYNSTQRQSAPASNIRSAGNNANTTYTSSANGGGRRNDSRKRPRNDKRNPGDNNFAERSSANRSDRNTGNARRIVRKAKFVTFDTNVPEIATEFAQILKPQPKAWCMRVNQCQFVESERILYNTPIAMADDIFEMTDIVASSQNIKIPWHDMCHFVYLDYNIGNSQLQRIVHNLNELIVHHGDDQQSINDVPNLVILSNANSTASLGRYTIHVGNCNYHCIAAVIASIIKVFNESGFLPTNAEDIYQFMQDNTDVCPMINSLADIYDDDTDYETDNEYDEPYNDYYTGNDNDDDGGDGNKDDDDDDDDDNYDNDDYGIYNVKGVMATIPSTKQIRWRKHKILPMNIDNETIMLEQQKNVKYPIKIDIYRAMDALAVPSAKANNLQPSVTDKRDCKQCRI